LNFIFNLGAATIHRADAWNVFSPEGNATEITCALPGSVWGALQIQRDDIAFYLRSGRIGRVDWVALSIVIVALTALALNWRRVIRGLNEFKAILKYMDDELRR